MPTAAAMSLCTPCTSLTTCPANNCTTTVYVGFRGSDKAGRTMNSGYQIQQINQYSISSVFWSLLDKVRRASACVCLRVCVCVCVCMCVHERVCPSASRQGLPARLFVSQSGRAAGFRCCCSAHHLPAGNRAGARPRPAALHSTSGGVAALCLTPASPPPPLSSPQAFNFVSNSGVTTSSSSTITTTQSAALNGSTDAALAAQQAG